MDQQHGDMDMDHGHEELKCSMAMQHEHAELDMQYWHTERTCKKDMYNRHVLIFKILGALFLRIQNGQIQLKACNKSQSIIRKKRWVITK